MKCELRLGLGILLTTLACDDGQKADLGVGVGGHPGTGGKSDVATGGATSGAPTLAGGGGEWAAGSAGRQSQAGAGIAGTGFELGYCRASYDETRAHAVFKCPTEFCAALTSAVSTSDSSLPVFSGAEVRAGRCTAPEDAFDSVYFGTGVGSTGCYYRAGVLVGMATWEDSSVSLSNGCPEAVLEGVPGAYCLSDTAQRRNGNSWSRQRCSARQLLPSDRRQLWALLRNGRANGSKLRRYRDGHTGPHRRLTPVFGVVPSSPRSIITRHRIPLRSQLTWRRAARLSAHPGQPRSHIACR